MKSIQEKELGTILRALSTRYRLSENELIILLYVFRAWKHIGSRGEIPEALTFDYFQRHAIDAKILDATVKKLSDITLFRLLPSILPSLERFESELLQVLANMSSSDEQVMLPRVDDYFYLSNKHDPGTIGSDQVAELSVRILEPKEELYVPCTYGFSYVYYSDSKVYAENMHVQSAFIAELINILENKTIIFHQSNALENPTFTQPGTPHLLRQFESVLAFPPMSMKKKLNLELDTFNRFRIHKGANLDVAYFEHVLAQTQEKAVVRMPVGFAYRSGSEEAFRKYLIENNMLEAVIHLPPSIYSYTAIETILLVANKCKNSNIVKFINTNHESFMTKEGRRTVFKSVDSIVNIYRGLDHKDMNNIDFPGVWAQVHNAEIAKNNYSLATNRYVSSQEIENIYEIIDEQNDVEILGDIAQIKKSQLFKDDEEGTEVYEISPSDFAEAGWTTHARKTKIIGSKQRKKLETYQLKPYDVLLSTKGTIGKVAIIAEGDKPMIASQAIHVIRIGDHLDDRYFAQCLYMYLKSSKIQTLLKHITAGSVMPQISSRDLSELPVPWWSKEETEEIRESFEEEITLQKKIETLQHEIQKIHDRILGENE